MTRTPRKTDDWNEGRIENRTTSMTTAILETWPAPAGHNPDPIKRTEQEAAGWVMLRDLVASGHLPVGTVLIAREGNYEGRSATVNADGLLEMDGKTYDTPSGAGKEVLGRAVNGWTFWRLPDGGKLIDVRQKSLGTYVDRKGLYESFWRDVIKRIKQADPDWTQASAPGANSWITLPYGASIAHYTLAFSVAGPVVDVEFGSADSQANLVEFEKFVARRYELEEKFGQPLAWEPLEGKKACRIRHYRLAGGQVTDADQRDELIDWFVSRSVRLRSSINGVRKALQGQ